jgi:hypothetical protein
MVLPPVVRAPKSQPRSFAVTIRGNRTPVVVSFLSAERALLASLKEVSVTRRRDVIMDIVVWLRSLGLEKYEAAFRENDIDETVLPSLTAEDLKNLGVSVVGHRLKLLDAIAALRTNANSKTDVATTTGTQSAPEDRAERRQVTVMFSDLVGFTALSARMDDGAACAHRGIIVDGCKRPAGLLRDRGKTAEQAGKPEAHAVFVGKGDRRQRYDGPDCKRGACSQRKQRRSESAGRRKSHKHPAHAGV